MRALRFTCAALLLLVSGLSAVAATKDLPQRTGVITDTASVIDAATRQRITALSNELYAKANARISVAVIDSLNGDDIDSYSNALFHSWGIGKKGSDRGVLIVLAVKDHKYRVEVGYGLEAILPDGRVGGFGREVVPYLKQQQYGLAVEKLARKIAGVIADDSHVTLNTLPQQAPARSQPVTSAPAKIPMSSTARMVVIIIFLIFPLMIFGTVFYIIYRIVKNKALPAFMTSNTSGRSNWNDSSSSSSSFDSSSSDSGSSDSGFSGGDSGGGGASGSW
jgi:uncharacterized protein